jgi:hypothetical protein
VPLAQRAITACERTVAELTGEPVETFAKRLYPSPDASLAVARWMERYEPQCVVLVVSSVWTGYETSVYRLGTVLPGPFKRLVKQAEHVGARTAKSRALHVRAARRVVRRTVGVAPRFTPAEVIASARACIQVVVRVEDVALVVRGPETRYPGNGRPATRARLEARRVEVDAAIAESCKRLYIDYLGREIDAPETDDHLFLPDGVHLNVATNLARGEREGEVLAAAWLRIHRGG